MLMSEDLEEVMSRSINSDKSWNSTDEEYEECENSSPNHSSIGRRISGEDIPGACITTHSVSSVIRPGCKMPKVDPLQFVKIKNNDLSKKAVEQIKLAEEVKITKEKIKEVEEEWQNNLLSWKSKRRQSKNSSEDESGTSLPTNRKTKTFSEILNEKAKSGQRIGYNLHKYLDGELENENDIRFDINSRNYDSKYNNDKNSGDNMNGDNHRIGNKHNNHNNNNNNIINSNHSINERSNLGDVIVFDTSLLEEFSHKQQEDSSEDSSIVDITSNCQQFNEQKSNNFENNSFNSGSGDQQNDKSFKTNKNNYDFSDDTNGRNGDNSSEDVLTSDRVNVDIKDWKQENSQRDNVLLYLLKQEQHNQQNQSQMFTEEDMSHLNSSYDAEDDEEDDEELERLRLEQEKSFRAKLSAFETLAKQENHNNININRANSKPKLRDENKRQPPAREDLIHSEQQIKERPIVGLYGVGHFNDSEDSEEGINARIQQLHIERQKAQRPTPLSLNGQSAQPQQLAPNVVYQSQNYNQNPSVTSPQSQPRPQYEQQQYYLMDEPIAKQTTPVKSPQPIRPQPTVQTVHKQPTQLPYKPQPIQPQEHLYVNQKQLFSNQNPNPNQYYEPIESHQRYGSEYYDSTYDTTQQLSQPIPQPIAQPIPQSPENGGIQSNVGKEGNYTSPHNQYLYYPKPYASKANKQIPVQKPVVSTQPHNSVPIQRTVPQTKPQPSVKPQKGYNQNHWLIQEAEHRRQMATIPAPTSIQPSTVSATQRPTTTASVHKSSPTPQKGMLSVSGKKKCSSCGDELGRGCAAMVVESLSLYYHINCFRCSVCNIQLGNGTVGTDVRVRNHKLHCQNCYSNDEAGLKFSRV